MHSPKLLYIAKHNSGDNDDEGAITHVFKKLGWEVICVHESEMSSEYFIEADLCLIHKYSNMELLREVAKSMPVVCWYFDLISSTDPLLQNRMGRRIEFIRQMETVASHIFCTDGDWVESQQHNTFTNYHWLTQGTDERFIGSGNPKNTTESYSLLFTGIINGGERRMQHIKHLQTKWGVDNFRIIGGSDKSPRIHQRQLADIFSCTKIVIAPQGLSTDRYWSNRVYLTLGLGGFLLHPYCHNLRNQYSEDELPMYMYHHMEGCDQLIEKYINEPELRNSHKVQSMKRTVEEHLYQHRIISLLKTLNLPQSTKETENGRSNSQTRILEKTTRRGKQNKRA